MNCKNNGLNSKYKFYRFPKAAFKKDQRDKWIKAVNRKNHDGTNWFPKAEDRICSAHFIGNEKSNIILSPSYIPTLLLSDQKIEESLKQQQALQRHKRFMERRPKKSVPPISSSAPKIVNKNSDLRLTRSIDTSASTLSDAGSPHNSREVSIATDESFLTDISNHSIEENPIVDSSESMQVQPLLVDKSCQVNTSLSCATNSNTFVIVKYVRSDSRNSCDVEIQTDIFVKDDFKIVTKINKGCETQRIDYVDKKVGPDVKREEMVSRNSFSGYSSIKKDEQMLDLAGVTCNNFNFLLDRITNNEKWQIKKEDRLLIFLTKLKTGMTYRALGVVFSLHRTTISHIFLSILDTLCKATENLIPWINSNVNQSLMPECFKDEYPNTRIIIACTEFRIEIPSTVEECVYTYSHYKHGFTSKVLIGIAPCGLIILKSRAARGRKSDSQITIESGLIDLLEDGDVVLTDKGFPAVIEKINEDGKKCFLIMPPFSEGHNEFTKEEAKQTYQVARVRIHVERIMQRLRTYRILDKIPQNLFPNIDNIIHICCVLVNLQPPILKTDLTDDD